LDVSGSASTIAAILAQRVLAKTVPNPCIFAVDQGTSRGEWFRALKSLARYAWRRIDQQVLSWLLHLVEVSYGR
jgi:hypothetical protein